MDARSEVLMRLDEWQKYIGSQFLDEEPETVAAPKTKAQTVPSLPAFLPDEEGQENPPPTPLPANSGVSQQPVVSPAIPEVPENTLTPSVTPAFATETLDSRSRELSSQGARPETTPNAIQNVVTMVVTPPLPTDTVSTVTRAPRIELLTPLPEQTSQLSQQDVPEVSNRTRRRSQTVHTETPTTPPGLPTSDEGSTASLAEDAVRARNLFQPIEDIDTDIPSFANYLPAASSNPFPPIHVKETLLPLSSSPSLFADSEQVEEVARHNNLALEENLPDTQALRRTSRSRTRHARNIRPEHVTSGMSAPEIRAAIPRHVLTLLSLEREEEVREVAQSSYKRPFQEKRHELIERLLDPILSLEDTARLLNVCPTTVRRYTNKGILTYYRKEPDRAVRSIGESDTPVEKETRQRRFRLSDVLAFLETQQAALAVDRQAEDRAARLASHIAEDNGKEP